MSLDYGWGVFGVVVEVMRSQGNLAFTYAERGETKYSMDQLLKMNIGHFKLVFKFIHTLQVYIGNLFQTLVGWMWANTCSKNRGRGGP